MTFPTFIGTSVDSQTFAFVVTECADFGDKL